MPSDNFRHGLAGYRRFGCKCEYCTLANRAAKRRTVENRMKRLREDPTAAGHGENDTYVTWGCKCDPCTRAHRDARRLERTRRAGETRSSRGAGKCIWCGGMFKLKKDGTLWAHGWIGARDVSADWCPGSGAKPDET